LEKRENVMGTERDGVLEPPHTVLLSVWERMKP
jgi:hypothetical protein